MGFGFGYFRCFEDRCPHRLAPLSEGRIDEQDGGTLMCNYHVSIYMLAACWATLRYLISMRRIDTCSDWPNGEHICVSFTYCSQHFRIIHVERDQFRLHCIKREVSSV
jgi:hypothetical protein